MNIYALDADRNLVTLGVPYSRLEWHRKYYEAGMFSMQVPLSIYDKTWKYVGTPDRPELGMLQKVVTTDNNQVQVSGFFCEKMLDDKTCYPRYIGDVPHTETAVRNIFTRFKDDIPIELASENSPLLGNRTQSDFSDDLLGRKLYSILESREMSYRILYDYVANKLSFQVWQGLDRTQAQNENAYQVFSSEFGNIQKRTVNLDNSNYKNYAIIPCNANDAGKEQNTYYLDWSDGDYKKTVVFDMRSKKPEENQTMEDFKASILQEASEKLVAYAKIDDVDINPVGGKGYLIDYDLGDKCDVILTDVGLKMETRIVGVEETFTSDEHAVTVELGNKRITNIRRMAL